jgi:hypothetical protein
MEKGGERRAVSRRDLSQEDLLGAADGYAAELNQLDPAATFEWLAEVAVESPYWDDRTSLLAMAAEGPEDAALVLATEPGGDDYVLVRWAGRWFVDSDPVDWQAVLEDLAD